MIENIEGLLSTIVSDPSQAEKIGHQLFNLTAETDASVVAVDPQPGSVILGYIVARQLNASLVIVSEDSGLLYTSDTPAPGSRIILLSIDFPDYPPLAGVIDYLTTDSTSVVAAISVSSSGKALLGVDIPSRSLQD